MSAEHDHGEHGHSHEELTHDRRVLWIVLALNFAMFMLEVWQGIRADSTSLIADSMDFLSDSFSYIVTLYVIQKHLHTRAKAALLKASLMLLLAAFVLMQGVHNIMMGDVPSYLTMGWVSLLALLANSVSALLLYSSRGRDSNMHSVWLCSRNDMAANILIMVAAFLVYLTGSLIPDLLVAIFIAWLGGDSALKIIRHARVELKSS